MNDLPKMFNRAIVFGSVLKSPVKKKTKGGSVYASLQLQCPNDVHGDVRVWGKIWGAAGQDALEDLKAGDMICLQGVFQQYESEYSGLVSNFNFFNKRPCIDREKQDLRAVFILVGDVVDLQSVPGGQEVPDLWRLTLAYQQHEGCENERDPEHYQLFATNTDVSLFEESLLGARIKVKGFLENEVDDFCEVTPTRPMIKEIKVLWSPAASADPPQSPLGRGEVEPTDEISGPESTLPLKKGESPEGEGVPF